MKRLPLKLKLTLAFAAAMAILLVATGLFLRLRLEAELDDSIDRSLRSQADHVAALVHRAGSGLRAHRGSGLVAEDERLAQILDARGRVIDASAGSGGRSVLTPEEVARARTATVVVEERKLLGADRRPARLLAHPVRTADGTSIVVVGTAVEERDEALSDLSTLLLIGGPVMLVLASLAAYAVTSASLRPVDSMRARAAEI